MSFGFQILSETCYGCKTCSISCAHDKQLRPGVFLRRVRLFDGGEKPVHAYVSMACNHCDEPACMNICPVGAYSKSEEGYVIQDHSMCIGCQSCINACPFHAPSFDEEEKKTYKCDACAGRQARGEEPVCVVSCPGSNILHGDFDALEGDALKDLGETKPNLKVAIDPDIELSMLTAIDENEAVVDRGGENY